MALLPKLGRPCGPSRPHQVTSYPLGHPSLTERELGHSR